MTQPDNTHELTQLLVAWSDGDDKALDKLLPLIEPELRRLAKRYMSRERPDHTLQATALVNEAYLKLIDQTRVRWQNRAHFFAIAAQAMRRILIDHARKHRYAKRGSGSRKVSIEEAFTLTTDVSHLLSLDEALAVLAKYDKRKERVVEMRYFGGLSFEEIAEVLELSPDTISREWRRARAWLYREMSS
jgi:RNA polymerase sigma-70 factor, ECF subfamily